MRELSNPFLLGAVGGARWRNERSEAGRGQLNHLKWVQRGHVELRAVMVHGMLNTNSQRREYMFGSDPNRFCRLLSGMPGGEMIGLEPVGANLIPYSGCSGATSNYEP